MGNVTSSSSAGPADDRRRLLRDEDAIDAQICESLDAQARFSPFADAIAEASGDDARRAAAAHVLQSAARRWLVAHARRICDTHELCWTHYVGRAGSPAPATDFISLHHDVAWHIWGLQKKTDEYDHEDLFFGEWTL